MVKRNLSGGSYYSNWSQSKNERNPKDKEILETEEAVINDGEWDTTVHKKQEYLNRWWKGKTTLIQKDTLRGTIPSTHWTITCLRIIWKIQNRLQKKYIANLIAVDYFLKKRRYEASEDE